MTPRVLQVVLSLNPGGTERLVVELAARLNPTIPTAVCCLDEPGAWAAELESRGVGVTGLGRRPGFHPSLGLAVARAARAHGASVLHAHHYSPFVYAAVARVTAPALRIVFTEHGRLSDAAPSRKRRAANAILGRMATRVFTVSRNLGDHVAQEGFAERVEVIYNGIDPGPAPDAVQRADARARLGVTPETFVIGTVARLDPVKDLGTLIRATATAAAGRPADRPVALVIVGDGRERAALEQQARDAGLGDAARFLGHREDARSWLAAFDVFVNCSISEGVSLTILEAMAAELPVVATRVGGTPEVIDAFSGRLCPARDAGALARELTALAADAGERRRLGTGARQRVLARFTLDRMVQEYADVYRAEAGA